MAEALGWGMTERPYPVIASGRSTGGPDKEKVGGSEAREAIYREMREGRWKLVGNAQARVTERDSDQPAPAIKGGKDFGERRWVFNRPATTVAGDPRIVQPGHKKDAEFPDAPRRMEESITVEIHEAAVLQGFPADYPFKGSKTKQFEQVGNAVPPGFARSVLASLLAEQTEGPAQLAAA